MKIELTPQSETELKQGILELVEGFLEAHDKVSSRVLGLITAQQLQDELGIKYKTLQRWENAGLPRYQPPLEDTRKVFYRVSDILIFLGGGRMNHEFYTGELENLVIELQERLDLLEARVEELENGKI